MSLILLSSAWAFGRKRDPKPNESCTAPAVQGAQSNSPPIALVDGQPIYNVDLAGPAAAQILQIQQQEYNLESQALDALVRQKVVEIEAKKQGLTADQLYQKEVDSKIADPSDDEARGYYLAAKSQVTLPFTSVEPQIKRLLKQAEIQEAREKYADALRAKADVTILLPPPTVEMGENDPVRVKGDPAAPITIVEFGDYQCPFCAKTEATVTDLLKKYDGKVKLAFRDFPFPTIHPFAEKAAKASRCAEAQGMFWPMHDAMYADQSKLAEPDLIHTAASLGIDQESFTACLNSNAFEAEIQKDVAAGQRAGVTGTPAFFINGRFVNGAVPEAQFEDVINSELAALKGGHLNTASQ